MLSEEEQEYRRQVVKIGSISIGMLLLIAYWYATQSVAAECDYHKDLGEYFSFGDMHIYPPFQFYFWQTDPTVAKAIPNVLASYAAYPYLAFFLGAGFTYLATKDLKKETSHGSASFATKKDIEKAGLGSYEGEGKNKKEKESGVVVGINPYTKKLMLHNGVEHILLMAPTRSGKGVNTIIPTGLVWKNSIFFFDVKGELWQATSGFRQKVFGQKVLKFAPLESDGSSVGDVATIVGIMVKPDGEKQGGNDPFWDNSAANLLQGVILHLMYQHYQEGLPLPCPTDIMSFLSSPDKTTDELFRYMKNYPHISPEEFFETEDENGVKRRNPLKEVYGEYIKNFKPFSDALKTPVHNLEELRQVMLKKEIDFAVHMKKEGEGQNAKEVEDMSYPYFMCLAHPKVAESAANILNGAEDTRASIIQTAQTAMALYQNPIVQKNTAVSDFCIRDLLSPEHTVSLYLCMQTNEVQTLKPLSRLLINTMLQKLIRDMKFDTSGGATMKQRLLLLLDEFPQLGNLKSMELALAVCAGYGIKVCIVAQDVNQLNKEYTKDNSIASNCHVHIYFTPNLDSGGATAAAISKNLGKKTIKVVSHSDGGGLGKGSNSESFIGRELMTPDEVSHLSQEKEIVFVAGNKPILGGKLRYYKQPVFLEKLKQYKKIYIKEHEWQENCKKYKNDCEKCVAEFKIPNNYPAIPCPDYPLYSDTVTAVRSYEELFAVHAAEISDQNARATAVSIEKEQEKLLSKDKKKQARKKQHQKSEEEKKIDVVENKEADVKITNEAGEAKDASQTAQENKTNVDLAKEADSVVNG